jgi:hypothetical protein
MKGATAEPWANTSRATIATRTIIIGRSHQSLLAHRKRNSSPMMPSLSIKPPVPPTSTSRRLAAKHRNLAPSGDFGKCDDEPRGTRVLPRPPWGAIFAQVRHEENQLWKGIRDERGISAPFERLQAVSGIPDGRTGLAAALRLACLLLLLSPFIAAIAAIVAGGVPDYPTSGDEALLEMSTRNTAEGLTLTGPYSRFGFNHPGPLYFFLRIPLYYASGMSSSSSYLTLCLIACLCLAGSLEIVRRSIPGASAALLCLVAAVYFRAMTPVIWLNEWNAFVIITPVLLMTLSLAAVSSGSWRWLPAAVFSGSFAAQTHLGSVPTVLASFLVTLVLVLAGRRKPDRPGILWLSAGLAAALWLPVAVQQMAAGREGNLTVLVRFFLESKPVAVAGNAVGEWAGSLASMEISLVPADLARRMGIVRQFLIGLSLLRIALLTVCLFLPGRRGSGGFLRALCAMSLTLHAVTLASALQVREEVHQFLLVWISVAGPLSWFSILASVWAASGIDRPGRVLPSIAVLLLAAAASFANIRSGASVRPGASADPRVGPLSGLLGEYLDRSGTGDACLLLSDHGLWPVMTGMVNDLQKRGFLIELDPRYRFMSGVPPARGAGFVLLGSDSLWSNGYSAFAGVDGALLGKPSI